MTVEQILTPIINQELNRYRQSGYQIKFKEAKNKRILYIILCILHVIAGFAFPFLFIGAIFFVRSIVTVSNDVKYIFSIAKKNPDKSIEQIIVEELNK